MDIMKELVRSLNAGYHERMDALFIQISDSIEPLSSSLYGPQYRCALTLHDGTYLPCAIIQSKKKFVDLAKRRIKEEMTEKGVIVNNDPYEEIVSSFITRSTINDEDVLDAEPSRFAPPISLLEQIDVETTMGWTGWVFEMTDGRLFAYGSSFRMEFFQLPDGYSFGDVAKVHNHSYLSKEGKLKKLKVGDVLPEDYDTDSIFRERAYFTCAFEDT